ncbi:MAG TPA: ABC transporter permease [Actinomycetales bacterium]|nr:ABC transporter permease [Actinomycetales bacterium]
MSRIDTATDSAAAGAPSTGTTPGTAPRPVHRGSSTASLVALAKAMLRSFFRDRMALFFTFLFPIMFLVVFGLVFTSSSGSAQTIGVVGDGALLKQLPTDILEPKAYASMDAAVQDVKDGDLAAVVTQEGDQLVLRYAASDMVTSATIRGVLQSLVDHANLAATGQPPTYSLSGSKVEDESMKPIQFITGGMLSWGVATSATFGAALTIVSWRKKKLLRRVRLSPAPVWTVVAARVGVSMVTAVIQAVLMIGIALTPPFGLQLAGSWYLMLPLLVFGTLSFLAIGLLVGAVAKTEEAASAMANFIVLPMAFLSGTFFDLSGAPAWMRIVSQAFPLRHMNDAMLDVLARGQGAGAIVVPCLILLAFALVVTAIATRLFQWDDA